MNSSRVNFIFLLLFGIKHTLSFHELRNYEDKCSSKYNCDHSKFLICVNNRCQCENPTDMVFDTGVNSCVTKLNENCFLEEIWSRGSGSFTQSSGPIGEYVLSSVKVIRKTPCETNLNCDEKTQKCVCASGTDKFGQCRTPKDASPLMKACDLKTKCQKNTGLRCVNGRCQCGVDYFQYFNGTNCVTRVDGPCQQTSDCVPFAQCVPQDGGHHVCDCNSGFVPSHDGRCNGGYGSACNMADMLCSEKKGLSCVNGKCQCPDESQIYVEGKRKKCTGLVGAKCYLHRGDSDFCTDNAACADVMEHVSFGVCECEYGYTETEDRTCEKT